MSERPHYPIDLEPERNAAKLEAVRDTLLSWFAENGRDLPWRKTRDPWRILVSEVMLQQIQVKRAVPFYEAFVKRFPTVAALAAAPISEAIKAWGDLGRYRRVVNLHRTARIVVDEFDGEIPSDPEALVKLPGIGPYTAGAVACFAFERDVACVDTNARRVLHRLFFGVDVPSPAVSEGEILSLAQTLVPSGRGWEWGQAVIELGALLCTARTPHCESCPLSELCVARHTIWGLLSNLPRTEKANYKYEGSNRYYRGRVLAALRAAPEEGITLHALGQSLREGFDQEDLPWLRGVVQSLEKDGLALLEQMPAARPAILAEEQSAYGTGAGSHDQAKSGDPREETAEERVRLP